MPMIPSSAIAILRQVATDIRLSDVQSITILRLGTAQSVRLTPPRRFAQRREVGEGLEQADELTSVVGAIDMDVQAGDRFRADGHLYEVILVRPNRTIRTVALARVVQ